MRLDFAPRLALAFIVTAGMAACAKEVRAPKPSPPSTPPSAPLAPMQRVIPLPSSVEPATGDGFPFTEATTILTPAGNQEVIRIGQYLSALIGTAAGKTPPRVDQAGAAPPVGAVQLVLGALPGAGEEGYELVISPERVTITAANPAGIFYGVQTLRQLLPPTIEYEAAVAEKSRPIVVPPGRIVDRPRFVWRGAMLDVARHFFDVDDVKRYVDLLALYKFNRLHLHLSDDQGWRLDIKSWPNLARHGGSTAVGGGPGGYYTQEAYTGLVKYAQDRFITIVPEIDMPGHTNAALASYPELNCNGVAPSLYTGIEVGFSTFCIDKDITYKFIDDVVREISAITAGPYFHVGGDEVEKLTPAQYKQFIERVQDIVQKHGKQMIGWDEIAPVNLLPTSIVQHWRPKANEGLAKAPRLIVSPANRAYLDMKYDKQTALGLNWAGYVDTRTAYSWDPAEVVKGVAEGAILGVEAPLWSETVVYMHDVEYMAFPRLAAIAEIGWSAAKQRQWDDFARRLGAQAPRWAALGVNFFRTSDVVWER
jgi:hexosaminidase